jgi:D-beta-D-heptose 7-phosphate kinase/D-beta-D-heptose 1-phosphate adenosyltransferase
MELDEYLTNTFTDNATIKKIKTQNAAIEWARQLKATGEKLVFANGCFDLLHTGHVYMLEKAKSLGTKLLVAVNDDTSIKALKGAARPIVSLPDRMKMLAALESIDCVVSFSHHDLEQLLENLKPMILVKGSEYSGSVIPGASVVEKYGGRVMLVDMRNGIGTTKLIDDIRKAESQ